MIAKEDVKASSFFVEDKKIKDDFCRSCLHLPANNIY